MLAEILGKHYYLILMLAIGVGLAALGRRWSEQERRQRQEKIKDESP